MTVTASRASEVAADRMAAPERASASERVATPRRYLMCEPRYFAVEYAINPWMDPTLPVDRDLAIRQWRSLAETYRDLGHQVAEIARSKAKRVVYASCEPGSFARDARTLQDSGYRLEKLKAIDQFLWSGHVELIALFIK